MDVRILSFLQLTMKQWCVLDAELGRKSALSCIPLSFSLGTLHFCSISGSETASGFGSGSFGSVARIPLFFSFLSLTKVYKAH